MQYFPACAAQGFTQGARFLAKLVYEKWIDFRIDRRLS